MAEGMSWKNPLDLVWVPACVQSSALLQFVISAVPEASWQRKQIWGVGCESAADSVLQDKQRFVVFKAGQMWEMQALREQKQNLVVSCHKRKVRTQRIPSLSVFQLKGNICPH